ncbi:protein bicaudal D homolog 2-like isoform X2 [Acipenser ruthenus]|uniref:protein bicaudal D homolog 2-like isoform X2 n=1 Tax=Acipenser ruthenus TaxID=7906 RepID=UPI00274080D6|nr:protein bicaudal D homolog 2-like isoform X2 [Acipenser ruthenus]
MLQDEVEASLRAEVARLSSELQEAEEEKQQAARYGLAVLEESGALKQKYTDLEMEHEGLRLELEHLKEALADSVSNHKKVTVDGENREESLLRETASREAALEERIEELQNELKQSRAAQNSTQSENERCSTLSHQLNKECERLEAERGQLQEDIKEYKIRELRQLQDNAELEEENISLQKQVSVLKENQVEFEAVKHELKRHSEELELLNAQLEEQARLREISERQLEEALEELKQEREQKNSLRRELASYSLNPFDSLCNLQQHLEELGLDASLPGEGEEEEGEGDSGFNNGALVNKVFRPAPSLVSDLLSELNLSETQRLRQQLLQTEREKAGLSGLVQELQRQVENTKGALVEQQGKTHKLAEQVEALQGCKALLLQHGEHGKEHCTGSGESGQDEYYELDVNRADILESRFRASNGELTRLRKDLKEAGAKYSALESKCKQEKDRWRGEAQELAEKIRQCIKSSRQDQERISELEKEIGATRKVATDSEGSLSMAQDELVAFSEELAYLYHHICTCSNVTPNRVMLDYYREGRGSRNPLRKRRSSDLYTKSLLNLDSPVAESGSSGEASPVGGTPNSPTLDFRDPSNVKNLIAVVRSQIKHLQVAVELSRRRGTLPASSSSPEAERDGEALLEEVLKLKSQLSTKREQIATLRTVLKANKQTAEVTLSNLKSKYESEKALVSETMVKLRNELKALKEDSATFSSMRSMFANRLADCPSRVEQALD